MFIYLKEIKLTAIYSVISLFLSFFISFSKLSSLIVLISYPIVKIFHKKLLILHALDLFNSSFLLSISIGSFFSILSFNLFIKFFFFSSWYKAQKQLINDCSCYILLFLLFYILLFLFLYKMIIHFLLIWDFKTFSSYKLFDIQFQILKFFKFQIYLFFSGLTILLLKLILCFNIKWFINWKNIFLYIKVCKKLIFSFFIIIIFLFLYDIFVQLFVASFLYILLEIIFVFICFKLTSFLK